jgi:CRISPR-associated protein Cmr2
MPESHHHALLKFQIGPVQDFIAQARSTRDLWSGSYLLSWLVAAGIRELLAPQHCASLVFPNPDGQPLLELPALPGDDHSSLLTPNLPNIFIARITGANPKVVAERVGNAVAAEWQAIASAVWIQPNRFGLEDSAKARFDAQVNRHLSIAWQITPLGGHYRDAYRDNGWQLDAVRQTRDFIGWDSATGMGEKDSLSGKEEALFGGTDFRDKRKKAGGEYGSLFSKHADFLGAVAIIKRVWHLAYLRDTTTDDKPSLKTSSRDFRIRSIPAIAARKSTHDDMDETGEAGGGDKYVAAIAFDGDSIGKWVNGDFLPQDKDLEEFQAKFSTALSNFALGRVRNIVEEPITGTDGKKSVLGQLIYAGGDDVVALVPADAALDIAWDLREAFRDCTKETPTTSKKPDASVGIAIGHIHAPLQDLVREAQVAEKRAKTTVGRSAFSITLMKRSGEISHWGSQWENGGLELYRSIDTALRKKTLSSRFPHRVCQLLEPYLTTRTGLSKQADAVTGTAVACDLITREFLHAAERQGSKETPGALAPALKTFLEGVLATREDRIKRSRKKPNETATQELLHAVLGLCTTVAFAVRNRENPAPPNKFENQSAA